MGSNRSGTTADVVGSLLWAAEQAASQLTAAKAEYAATGNKGSVANMPSMSWMMLSTEPLNLMTFTVDRSGSVYLTDQSLDQDKIKSTYILDYWLFCYKTPAVTKAELSL